MKTQTAFLMAAVFLTACGGGGGGSSTSSSVTQPPVTTPPSSVPKTVSGAVDPSISVAEICYDENDNGICDSNEQSVFNTNSYTFTTGGVAHAIIIVTNNAGTVNAPVASSTVITPVSLFATYLHERFPNLSATEIDTYIRSAFFLNASTNIYTDSNPTADSTIVSVLAKYNTVKNNLAATYMPSDDDAIMQYVAEQQFYFGNVATNHYALNSNLRVSIDILKKGVVAANYNDVVAGSLYSINQATSQYSFYGHYYLSNNQPKFVSITHNFSTGTTVTGNEYSAATLVDQNTAVARLDPVSGTYTSINDTESCTSDPVNPVCTWDWGATLNSTSGVFENATKYSTTVMHAGISASRLDISGEPLQQGLKACNYNYASGSIANVSSTVVFPAGSYCYTPTYSYKEDNFFITNKIDCPAGLNCTTNPHYTAPTYYSGVRGLPAMDCCGDWIYDNLSRSNVNTFATVMSYAYNQIIVSDNYTWGGLYAFALTDLSANTISSYVIDNTKGYQDPTMLIPSATKQLTHHVEGTSDYYVLEGGVSVTPGGNLFVGVLPAFQSFPQQIIAGKYERANYPSPMRNSNGFGSDALSLLNATAFAAVQPYL